MAVAEDTHAQDLHQEISAETMTVTADASSLQGEGDTHLQAHTVVDLTATNGGARLLHLATTAESAATTTHPVVAGPILRAADVED